MLFNESQLKGHVSQNHELIGIVQPVNTLQFMLQLRGRRSIKDRKSSVRDSLLHSRFQSRHVVGEERCVTTLKNGCVAGHVRESLQAFQPVPGVQNSKFTNKTKTRGDQNFPGVQLTSLPIYRRALLYERLEQATGVPSPFPTLVCPRFFSFVNFSPAHYTWNRLSLPTSYSEEGAFSVRAHEKTMETVD